MATHHGRPGGRGLELLVLLLVLISTVAVVVGTVLIVRWLSPNMAYLAIGLGFALSVPLWRAFLRYYKYEAHTLKPIIEKDDPK